MNAIPYRILVPLASALAAAVLLSAGARAQCLVAELTPDNVGDGVFFGSALGLSGDLLVVGAQLDDEAGTDAGALYVFERLAGQWQATDKLTVPGAARLGGDVAVSGERILAGANGGFGPSGQARAYLFERVGAAWTIAATFEPPDPQIDDGFGLAVALAGDVAVVGREHGPFPGPGQARVYEPIGGSWVETALVDGGFLTGAAVATDGERVLVGRVPDVLVLERSGPNWVAAGSLLATPGFPSGFFGKDLAISGDLAFVPSEQNDLVGSVHVFERGAAGWEQTEVLLSKQLFESTYFGYTLSYSPASGVLLVGSPLHGNAVHGYLHEGDDWNELFDLQQPPPGFGWGSAIDGHRLAVAQFGNLPEAAPTAFVHEIGTGLSLFGCPQTLSLQAGGQQRLALAAGAEHAGAPYLLLGSASGTSPGLASGSLVLPLNLDDYFLWTLQHPNTPPLGHTLGLLDAQGKAQAHWTLPPATNTALAGIQLHHAYAVLGLPALEVTMVSVALPLSLVP